MLVTESGSSAVRDFCAPLLLPLIMSRVAGSGQRDESKRPVMGAVAAHLSDVLIITDDHCLAKRATSKVLAESVSSSPCPMLDQATGRDKSSGL